MNVAASSAIPRTLDATPPDGTPRLAQATTSRGAALRRSAAIKLRSALVMLLVTAGLILGIEVFLRVAFHYPRGYFRFMAADGTKLYPPSTVIPMRWGAIPYEVKTNALGFRGDEIDRVAPPGRQRIVAIGDSVTDGFFADNDATFPAQLQRYLRAAGRDVEVINAARGGGSIDKEYAILREHGFPLQPDVVVLTFVTNDIFDIRERSLDDLLTRDLHAPAQGLGSRVLTETAIGEWVTDRALRARFRSYRAADRQVESVVTTTRDPRYELWGADHFDENIDRFRTLTAKMDGMVLTEPFSAEVNGIIANYVAILDRMNRDCIQRNARLVFVYFPAYSQVYDPGASLAIRDLLAAECAARKIELVDLTGPFRAEGRTTVLHLAPVDFHPNPAGNRLMARTVGARLTAPIGG
ncbi:MAG: SGNH/GDSL hydrolase family protein [Byssovorax sp.]